MTPTEAEIWMKLLDFLEHLTLMVNILGNCTIVAFAVVGIALIILFDRTKKREVDYCEKGLCFV